MSVRRAITLTALSLVWVLACLVLPPIAAQWLSNRETAIVMPPRVIEPARVPPASDPASQWRSRFAQSDEDSRGKLDVYGNEISRPVARYRVDDHGTLYEVHSPQTEVPKLRPPRL